MNECGWQTKLLVNDQISKLWMNVVGQGKDYVKTRSGRRREAELKVKLEEGAAEPGIHIYIQKYLTIFFHTKIVNYISINIFSMNLMKCIFWSEHPVFRLSFEICRHWTIFPTFMNNKQVKEKICWLFHQMKKDKRVALVFSGWIWIFFFRRVSHLDPVNFRPDFRKF